MPHVAYVLLPVGGAAASTGVSRLVAGTNITLSPTGGTGEVTITAASSGDGSLTAVSKASTQSVTSSTTLQNDASLYFAVGANETWVARVRLFHRRPADVGVKWGFTVPTGAIARASVFGVSAGSQFFDGVPVHNESETPGGIGATGTLGTGNVKVAIIEAYVANGSTAGNLTLQWAQQSSSATATRVFAGSFLCAVKPTVQ